MIGGGPSDRTSPADATFAQMAEGYAPAQPEVCREQTAWAGCLSTQHSGNYVAKGFGFPRVALAAFVYSSFGIAVDREHALTWLFHQEKATLNYTQESRCIPKLL